MIKNSTLLLSAALLLAACGEKDDDTGSTGTDSGTDTTDDSITPAEGEWYASDETIEKDSCGFDNGEDTGGSVDDSPVILTLTSDTTFTLTDSEPDGIDQTCTFDSTGAFTCDGSSDTTDFTAHGIDAVLTVSQAFAGAFTSSTTGSVTMTFSGSCEGEDCGFISKQGGIPLPCSTVMSVTITHGG